MNGVRRTEKQLADSELENVDDVVRVGEADDSITLDAIAEELPDGMIENDDGSITIIDEDESEESEDDGEKASKKAEEEEPEEKEDKTASRRVATQRPQPRKPSQGLSRVGSVGLTGSGNEISELSRLWETKPDVSEFFGK